jgi:Protein of unknown function (DUF3396)
MVFESEEEGTYMVTCLDLIAYWRGSVFDRVPAVLNFHREMARLVGDQIAWYTTEAMENAKKRNDETLGLLEFWLTGKKRKRGIYILSLESAKKKNTPSDAGFYFAADEEADSKGGLVRMILPIGLFADEPAALVKLTRSVLDDFDFEFATAGFSVNWNPNGDSAYEAQEKLPFVARRFPGVDVIDYDATLYSMTGSAQRGFKCANWITALGAPLLDHFEPGALRNELGADLPVIALAKGVMIVAGQRPLIGDKNRDERLDDYHRVGRVLAPARLPKHAEFVGAVQSEPNLDITDEWLARFDA